MKLHLSEGAYYWSGLSKLNLLLGAPIGILWYFTKGVVKTEYDLWKICFSIYISFKSEPQYKVYAYKEKKVYCKLPNFSFSTRFEKAVPTVEKLCEEIKVLEDVVSQMKGKQVVTFCHNDLLIANFIYDEYQSRFFF